MTTKPEQPEPEFITLRRDALPELVATILQVGGDVEGCTCEAADEPSGNCRACYDDQLRRGIASIIAAEVSIPSCARDLATRILMAVVDDRGAFANGGRDMVRLRDRLALLIASSTAAIIAAGVPPKCDPPYHVRATIDAEVVESCERGEIASMVVPPPAPLPASAGTEDQSTIERWVYRMLAVGESRAGKEQPSGWHRMSKGRLVCDDGRELQVVLRPIPDAPKRQPSPAEVSWRFDDHTRDFYPTVTKPPAYRPCVGCGHSWERCCGRLENVGDRCCSACAHPGTSKPAASIEPANVQEVSDAERAALIADMSERIAAPGVVGHVPSASDLLATPPYSRADEIEAYRHGFRDGQSRRSDAANLGLDSTAADHEPVLCPRCQSSEHKACGQDGMFHVSDCVMKQVRRCERDGYDDAPVTETTPTCHASKDGECIWVGCPQLRDGEPAKSGRHCPLDWRCGDEECDGTCAQCRERLTRTWAFADAEPEREAIYCKLHPDQNCACVEIIGRSIATAALPVAQATEPPCIDCGGDKVRHCEGRLDGSHDACPLDHSHPYRTAEPPRVLSARSSTIEESEWEIIASSTQAIHATVANIPIDSEECQIEVGAVVKRAIERARRAAPPLDAWALAEEIARHFVEICDPERETRKSEVRAIIERAAGRRG